jgi:hypothetical protein
MTTADYGPPTDAATEATPTSAETAPVEVETSGEHLAPEHAFVDFRSHWAVIQQGFVDDPWSAVKDADRLIGDALEKLAAIFEEQREQLAGQWSDGEPDTEELRLTLRSYRDFLDRLLTLITT